MTKRRPPQAQTHRKHTRDSINAAFKNAGRGIELIDEYTHATEYLKYRCTEHGHEFEATLNSALYAGRGCPKCGNYSAPERQGRQIDGEGRARNRSFFKKVDTPANS
jgi:ssDNA-binding Zn-finger/Zn-ribbon topoisomerase 1